MGNVGLFAGVFDPIHLGHTEFIKRAINSQRLDKVYVLIERKPKYKTCIASQADRKKMVELALEDIKEAEIFEPESDFFPVTSALPDIRKMYPGSKLYLLAGDDVASRIGEWKERDVLEGVGLVVAKRGSEGKYMDVSSLKVREKIKKGEKPELDPKVLDYCESNRIY